MQNLDGKLYELGTLEEAFVQSIASIYFELPKCAFSAVIALTRRNREVN